ncbi:MAG: type pilus assembly protein PilC [Clostridia bacterium]|jgi:type IV pilus assembly protein PilC|nr:type pilus assembly protein PilC [Clostridia bacterium]MDN5323714.1 type pilus assembly protein PilC [Clostridia bacterium]
MALYVYKARDIMGKMTEGQLEAEALNQAVAKLQQSGLFVIDIKQTNKQKKETNLRLDFFSRDKIKLKDLALFCRQLSFMLEAGVSLVTGLQIIVDNQAPPGIKRLAQGLVRELRAGHSFGEACAEFSNKLPPLLIDMVAAAEVGGFLDSALERLANYFDKEVHTKEKVKTAMIYPIVVMVIAVLAISVVFTFVVPVFGGILKDMNVPIPVGTEVILTLSLIFRKYWYLLFIGIVLLLITFIIYSKTSQGKKQVDDLLFKIPILKDLAQKVIVARFCRTLANLLHSGVPILKALEVVERTIGNAALKKETDKAQKNVKDGKSLTDSFKEGKVFPPMVIQMMAVGEQSGNLDELLVKVSDYYDNEVSEAADRLPKLIEPVMLVILGVVVGTIVMGVLMPMFSVMSSLGG